MNQEYEQTIINSANSLLEGQGDGRISEKDMTFLLNQEYTTSKQIYTLLHIYNTYNLTEPAKKKFIESLQIKI